MILKNGSKGEEVKQLQERLGLPSPDGVFGKNTEAAVKKWQKENGLKADGIVGPKTLELLLAPVAKPEAISERIVTKETDVWVLKGHIPLGVLQELDEISERFSITTSLRIAHFLSQCSHESGGFKHVFENLNYSASGLKRVFSKYFPGTLNESYAMKPQKIGARVYGGRMGNGDESTGDGYTYRGRGYIQLTGKSNYTRFSKFIGEDVVKNPDLVATKYPLASAAFFFNSNRIWDICDRGSSPAVVEAVTRAVNGGTNGLEDRQKHFNKYYSLLT